MERMEREQSVRPAGPTEGDYNATKFSCCSRRGRPARGRRKPEQGQRSGGATASLPWHVGVATFCTSDGSVVFLVSLIIFFFFN